MKYFLLLLFAFPINAFAAETAPEEGILIETYQVDVTGDGENDTIELKGKLFAPDAQYYQDIWAEVRASDGKEWKISYGGGYEPKLQFIDLNHDGIKDIFIKVRLVVVGAYILLSGTH